MAQTLDLGKVLGSAMHNVTAAPAASLGLIGDWAMDTATGDVYQKTTETQWEKRGNFKGAAGEAGTNGTNGAQGIPGTNGATGATGAPGTNGTNGAPGADGKTPMLTIDASGHLIATYA